GRHQKRLLAITRDEARAHLGMVLPAPDGTGTYATASVQGGTVHGGARRSPGLRRWSSFPDALLPGGATFRQTTSGARVHPSGAGWRKGLCLEVGLRSCLRTSGVMSGVGGEDVASGAR